MAKKSTVEQLNKGERTALAHLHGTAAYAALVKVRDIEVLGLASDSLLAEDIGRVKFLKGQVVWANNLIKLIEELHDKDK